MTHFTLCFLELAILRVADLCIALADESNRVAVDAVCRVRVHAVRDDAPITASLAISRHEHLLLEPPRADGSSERWTNKKTEGTPGRVKPTVD